MGGGIQGAHATTAPWPICILFAGAVQAANPVTAGLLRRAQALPKGDALPLLA